jgi:hypothetical protein
MGHAAARREKKFFAHAHVWPLKRRIHSWIERRVTFCPTHPQHGARRLIRG